MADLGELQDFEPYKDKRLFNTFGMVAIFFLGTFLIVLIISTVSCVFLVDGFKKLYIIFHTSNSDIFHSFLGVFQRWLMYWKFWIINRRKMVIVTNHFFQVKLFLTSIVPSLIWVYLIYKNWDKIADKIIEKKTQSLHGDAHWATEKEIRKAGLFDTKGLLLGEYKKGQYFTTNNYQHVLLFAPTGSGKGVGFVIPNLLFWAESVFVHDIKLENYELTSGYRSGVLKQKVYAWVPADVNGMSHCYNPLDWISKNPGQMVDDVQKIGNILIEKQEFWENEARALVVGVILVAIGDPGKQQSFGEVVRILRSDDTAYTLATSMDTYGDQIHPVGRMNISAFLQKPDKERSGCVSTANSRLDLWSNPIIDQTTSRSDFDIQTFKKIITTVYVGLTPDNIQRLRPLMSMFYQQATAFLSRKMPGKDEPYGVLFLMDEFPTLGKMEQFLSGIAYFRGYHVKLFLIIQDTQQLKGTYEDSGMNSFLSNATYRITFAANNVETAKLISELIGNKTVASESMNVSRYIDLNPANKSVNKSKTQRALLLPQEVITLDRDKQIILIEATSPIMCKKIKYWADPFFKKRLLKNIPLPKQKIKVAGSKEEETNEVPDIKLLVGHQDAVRTPDPEPVADQQQE